MRRHFFSLLFFTVFLAFITSGLYAFDYDWGGEITNITGYIFPEKEEFIQENKLSLWASGEQVFDPSSVSFTAQGSYLYTDERSYLIDLDLMRLRGRFPGLIGGKSLFETTAGRYTFSDPTGYLLSHTADGASMRLVFRRVELQADGAYTGLLLNPSSAIRVSDVDFTEKYDEDEHTFGPKRFILQGKLAFTDLGALRRWDFYGLAQYDMRDAEGSEETIDTQFWGTKMGFSIGRNLYHDGFITVGTSQVSSAENTEKLSLLTGFQTRYIREDWLASRLSLEALAASPDAPVEDLDIGFDVPFGLSQVRPLNAPALGKVVEPALDSLLYAGGDYSLRPFINGRSEVLGRLQPSIGARTYFRVYKWNADWMELNEDSNSWFLGTEYSAAVAWRIFSDLSAGLEGAMFVPGTAWSKEADMEYLVRFQLSASF